MNIKIKEFKEKQKNKLEEFKEKQRIKLEEFKEKLKIKLKEFKEKQKNKKIKGGAFRKKEYIILFNNTDTILTDEDIDLYIEYIIANLIYVYHILYKPSDKFKLDISDDELLNYINNKNGTVISNLKQAFTQYKDNIITRLFSQNNLENDDYFIELLSIPTDKLVKFIKNIPPFTNVDSIDIMIKSIIYTYVTESIYNRYKKQYCKNGTDSIDNNKIIKINGICYNILILIASIIEDLNKIDPIYPRIKDVSSNADISISTNLNKKTLKKIYKYIKDNSITIEKPVDLFFNNLNTFTIENTQEIKKLFVDNNLQFSFNNNKWEELSDININYFIQDITTFINKFDNTNIKPDDKFEDNINGIKNINYNNDIYYNNIISDNDIYEKIRLNKLNILVANKQIELNKPVEVFLNNIDKLKLTPRDNFKKNINEIFKKNNIVYDNNEWKIK